MQGKDRALTTLESSRNELDTLGISGVFRSLQGEGLHTGLLMTFIRFQYCPWDCNWCDEKQTWGKGDFKSERLVGELVRECEGLRWVCITGGEPLAQPHGFAELVSRLKPLGHKIEVETSGLNPLPKEPTFSQVDSWVVDVKLPSAGLSRGTPYFKDFLRLRPCDQLKFVVSGDNNRQDGEAAFRILQEYNSQATILISPVFDDDGKMNQEAFRTARHLCLVGNYRMSVQVHKFLGVR